MLIKHSTHPFVRAMYLLLMAQLGAFSVTAIARTGVLEETIVTAQKREQNLQDVPLAVTVLSGSELELAQENEIGSLQKNVPSFIFSEGNSDQERNLLIRGVGTQSFSRGVDQSVSAVVDGLVATGVAAAVLDFSDVQRIEVLRGPQGMLFGKNASAGVLNIVTRNPTEEFEAKLGASYGDEDEVKLNGFVSGPLGENVQGRIAAYSNKRDAFLENIYPGGKDMNDRDEWGVRGKIAYQPTETLEIKATLNHVERDQHCCANPALELVPGSRAEEVGVPAGNENTKLDDRETTRTDTKLDNVILDANYDWANYSVTSITSYVDTKTKDSFLSFNVPYPLGVQNDSEDNSEQFTQEFRLASPTGGTIDYLLGLYYFHKEIKRENTRALDVFGVAGAPIPLPAPGIIYLIGHNKSKVKNESYALFGQGTWNLTEHVRLTLGARLNREVVDLDLTVDQPDDLYPDIPIRLPTSTPGMISESESDNSTSWRFVAEYDFTDEAMIFASAAKGYKGPGANTIPNAITSDQPIVDPEIPYSYELGVKSRWLDNRMQINTTAFYTKFKDFQASVVVPDSIPPVFVLDNADELETQGVEVELSTQINDNLFLSSWVAYVDAEFTDYDGVACWPGQPPPECINNQQDVSGKRIPNSPKWSYNISGNYVQNIPSFPLEGFARFTYYWRDDVQYQTTNGPDTIGDSAGTFDFSIGVEEEDGKYQLQIWVKNLFDEFQEVRLDDRGVEINGQSITHGLAYDYTRRVGVSAWVRF
ncbi:MAG: TonB-dependent receptor [Halieaceae bacterium]|nr:TonB-dependent receptor [Halieaceae bacterium]